MGKKVEIQLSNQLHNKLLKQAEEQTRTLEEHILSIITEIEKNQDKQIMDYKQYVAKELEMLINKIKGEEEPNGFPLKKEKIIIYSLRMYKQKLPKDLNEIIEYYQNKNWFNEEYFYLIMDRKKIVGYMGFNPQVEAMPFGEYLFLYTLYLSKEYQNSKNINYIAGFINAVAKKEKFYSVDISSVFTNIEEKSLLSMGFIKFDTAILIDGGIKNNIDAKENIKHEKIQLNQVMEKGLLVSGRMLPIGFLYNRWMEKETDLETTLHKISKKHQSVEFVVVKEKSQQNKDLIVKYTVLVEPDILFDKNSLRRIYKRVYYLLHQDYENKIQLIIPDELLEEIEFIEIKGMKKTCWYRKMII